MRCWCVFLLSGTECGCVGWDNLGYSPSPRHCGWAQIWTDLFIKCVVTALNTSPMSFCDALRPKSENFNECYWMVKTLPKLEKVQSKYRSVISFHIQIFDILKFRSCQWEVVCAVEDDIGVRPVCNGGRFIAESFVSQEFRFNFLLNMF